MSAAAPASRAVREHPEKRALVIDHVREALRPHVAEANLPKSPIELC